MPKGRPRLVRLVSQTSCLVQLRYLVVLGDGLVHDEGETRIVRRGGRSPDDKRRVTLPYLHHGRWGDRQILAMQPVELYQPFRRIILQMEGSAKARASSRSGLCLPSARGTQRSWARSQITIRYAIFCMMWMRSKRTGEDGVPVDGR